jgi:hypothetical protein
VDNWKNISADRKMKKLKKYSLVMPKADIAVIPLECPVCEILMSSLEDTLAYQEYNCCRGCELMWVYPNKTRWLTGWRPPVEQLKQYKDEKNSIPSFIYKVK